MEKDKDPNDGKSPNLEMLTHTLDTAQEQIRFADSKAAFVALFHTILFGFIATQLDTLAKVDGGVRTCAFWFAAGSLAAYVTATVVAVIYAIRCVVPNLGETAPQCRIHFGHIVAGYPRDHDRYCREISAYDACAWANDLG